MVWSERPALLGGIHKKWSWKSSRKAWKSKERSVHVPLVKFSSVEHTSSLKVSWFPVYNPTGLYKKKELARSRITAPCLKVVGDEGEGGGWVYKDRLPIQEYSEEQTTMSSVCAALNALNNVFPETPPCKSPASTGCCLSQFLFQGETGIFLPVVLTCHFNLKWTYPQKQMVDELPITALTSQLKGMSTWAKNCTAANLFSVLRWTDAPSSWRACCHGHCWRQPGEVLLGTDKRGFHDAVPCFISGAILCLPRLC